jgi:hypothetical protein
MSILPAATNDHVIPVRAQYVRLGILEACTLRVDGGTIGGSDISRWAGW